MHAVYWIILASLLAGIVTLSLWAFLACLVTGLLAYDLFRDRTWDFLRD